MTEQEMYAYIFYHLADKVADAKKEARELMRQYLERGFEPEDMVADYTLMELDLAYLKNMEDYTGNEIVVYVDPDDVDD
jgi:hypothetical protein